MKTTVIRVVALLVMTSVLGAAGCSSDNDDHGRKYRDRDDDRNDRRDDRRGDRDDRRDRR